MIFIAFLILTAVAIKVTLSSHSHPSLKTARDFTIKLTLSPAKDFSSLKDALDPQKKNIKKEIFYGMQSWFKDFLLDFIVFLVQYGFFYLICWMMKSFSFNLKYETL